MNIIEKIKNDTRNSSDIVIRDLTIDNKKIYLVFSEVLCDGEYINDFILKRITIIDSANNLFNKIYNNVPSNSIKTINDYNTALKTIFQGYCLILIDEKFLLIEAKAKLDRGIDTTETEFAPYGPKDAFTENLNKNLGLIRKRIRTNNLVSKQFILGLESNTRISLCFMKDIAQDKLIDEVSNKLEKINIDGIIDIGYIRERLLDDEGMFPTANITERPDTVSQALLEGKIVILVDNTPYALILPTFFIDFFHSPDDYYQKAINVSFIRIIRFIAFIISIFLPAYYISITTQNPESISLSLLTSFSHQRLGVPFPGFIEALIMIICFEILRESDARIPSKMGSSVSILGGLVLGDAAVSAGIVSPIMIIIIAISMISSLIFTSNSLIYPIRYYRILLLLLAAFFGLYGVFIGLMLLIIKLCSINTFNFSYMTPFSPIIKEELKDSLIKKKRKGKIYRNPALAEKNLLRGKTYE